MSLRDDLAGVLARDPRYSIQAYAFVFEALEYTKKPEEAAPGAPGPESRPPRPLAARHRPGALRGGPPPGPRALRPAGADRPQAQWGIRSTSDLGEIVYNLIASGDLEKTPATRGPISTTSSTSSRLPPRLRPGAGRRRLARVRSRRSHVGSSPPVVHRGALDLPGLDRVARAPGVAVRPASGPVRRGRGTLADGDGRRPRSAHQLDTES